MREFALVPGLTKVMNRDDWQKVFLATAQLPDYRDTKYSSYSETKDSHLREGKLYYKKVKLDQGGYSYDVVSHIEIPAEDTAVGGKYEFVGYTLSGNLVGSTYAGEELFERLTAYYVHDDDDGMIRLTETTEENARYPKFQMGSSINEWLVRNRAYGYSRIYKRDVVRSGSSASADVTAGPSYYNVNYDLGALTVVPTLIIGSYLNSYIYKATTDRVYIKGHVYYRKTDVNEYLLEAGWNPGDIIDDVTSVYHRTNVVYLVNFDITGTLAHGKGYYERTGSRFPYEGFVGVATSSGDNQAKGAFYRCKRRKYMLTEDTIRNWDKSYYEFHEDTGKYIERSSSSEEVYRRVDGTTFIQAPYEDTFLVDKKYYVDMRGTELVAFDVLTDVVAGSTFRSGFLYYKLDENGAYRRLWPGEDYEVNDSAPAGIKYIDPETSGLHAARNTYISDYNREMSTTVGCRHRPLFYRNGWSFVAPSVLYGLTTDTKFDFSNGRKYYFYQGTEYDWGVIDENNVFTVCTDTVFGYKTLTDTYYGYRKLIAGEDYNVGDAIPAGKVFVPSPTDRSKIKTIAETGNYAVDQEYHVRDTEHVPQQTSGSVSTVYHIYDSVNNRVGTEPLVIDASNIGSSIGNIVYQPYADEDLPTYYQMVNNEQREWSAKFGVFEVTADYYGTLIGSQSTTIYWNNNNGTIPTAMDICVPFEDEPTDPYSKEGLSLPGVELYLQAKAGESILEDEYYEEAIGIYFWERYFIDKGVSSSTVYDIGAYLVNGHIYFTWKDPELMIKTTDPTEGPDSWYKTTLDFYPAGSSTPVQMHVSINKNEFGSKYLDWDCESTRAEGSRLITMEDAMNGTFKLTAISATGMLAPNQAFKVRSVTFDPTDKTYVRLATTGIAIPGVRYYDNDTNAELVNVEPFTSAVSNCYIKYQDDMDVYRKVGDVYVPITIHNDKTAGADATVGAKIDLTEDKYVYIRNAPEVSVAELVRSGVAKQLFGIGDVMSTPISCAWASDGTRSSVGDDAVIVDFDHVAAVRRFEYAYTPSSDTTVDASKTYYMPCRTTSVECSDDAYEYVRVDGLTANAPFPAAMVGRIYVHDYSKSHYNFYTRVKDGMSFKYSRVEFDSAKEWEKTVQDPLQPLFYKDLGKAVSGTDVRVTDGTVTTMPTSFEGYMPYDAPGHSMTVQMRTATPYTKNGSQTRVNEVDFSDGTEFTWDVSMLRSWLNSTEPTGYDDQYQVPSGFLNGIDVEKLGISPVINNVVLLKRSTSSTRNADGNSVTETVYTEESRKRVIDTVWIPSVEQVGGKQLFDGDLIVPAPGEDGVLDYYGTVGISSWNANMWLRTTPLASTPEYATRTTSDRSVGLVEPGDTCYCCPAFTVA